MESVLNAFYAVMAVYGFWQWRQGRGGAALAVCRWPVRRHFMAVLGIVAYRGQFVFPAAIHAGRVALADSMVTWSSVFATFLVARKVFENWHWWLVIDSVSSCLYFTRHLYLTMLLFCLYVS